MTSEENLQFSSLGKYEILRRLENLGHGESYLARETPAGPDRLVKRMPHEVFRDSRARDFCQACITRNSTFRHTSLPTIHESFTTKEGLWVIYDAMIGGEFKVERLPEDIGAAAQGLIPLIEGIRVLHQGGSVHGAIRPSSIVVAGEQKIWIDFGLAYAPAVLIGKAPHIVEAAKFASPQPPEEAASDLYSLGVLLHYAFTGTVPFDGADAWAIVASKSREPQRPKGLPPKLEHLLVRLLGEDPKSRPSAAEILAILADVAGARPSAPPKPAASTKKKLLLSIAGFLMVTLLVVIVWPSTKSRDSAESTFRALLAQADAALAKKDFAVAGGLYDKALQIKPSQEALDKRRKCQEALDQESASFAAAVALDRIHRLVRDQESLDRIEQECRAFLAQYPNSPHAPDVRVLLEMADRSHRPIGTPTAGLQEIKKFIEGKEYARSREALVPLLAGQDRQEAAALLSRVALQEDRWEKFEGFSTFTLAESGVEIQKDSGEILAWGFSGDAAVLRLKDFPAGSVSGLTLELSIEEKSAAQQGIGIVFDCRGPDTYKQILCDGSACELKSRQKKTWANLGSCPLPAQGLGAWHRLLLLMEGPSFVALCDGSAVFAGSSNDMRFTADTRILIEGCRGRIRDVRLRR